MLDLKTIRQRAETRANVANPANPANWLIEPTPADPPISQLATVATQNRPEQTCRDCRHRSAAGTCREPVAAGLLTAAEGFGIVWPGPGHGATCPAWSRSPAQAIAAVLVAAGRGGWPDDLMHQWLRDAEQHPEAVLDALHRGDSGESRNRRVTPWA